MQNKFKIIITLVIGIIIGTLGYVTAEGIISVINANQVGFSNTKSGEEVDNVQDAIDELFDIAKVHCSKNMHCIPEYINNGLKLFYDGESQPINNKWIDLSGHGNDGTVVGATHTSNSLSFDGDDYVSIGEFNPEHITVETVFSVSNSTTGYAYQTLIGNCEQGGFDIVYRNSIKKLYAEVYIDGSYRSFISSNPIEFNEKHSMTLTYDGNKLEIYIDGVFQYKYENDAGIKLPDKSTYLMIGTNPSGSNAVSDFFDGKIYSTRVYDRALNQKEITHNYNIDKIRFGI